MANWNMYLSFYYYLSPSPQWHSTPLSLTWQDNCKYFIFRASCDHEQKSPGDRHSLLLGELHFPINTRNRSHFPQHIICPRLSFHLEEPDTCSLVTNELLLIFRIKEGDRCDHLRRLLT